MSARIFIAIVAALGGSFSLAFAGPVDDCNQVRDQDRQLRGCSAYIKKSSNPGRNLATAYLNRANIYARRGKYEMALSDYASAIASDPSNSLAFYNRGNVYFDTKQFELAINDFTHAIELAPGFTLAYLNRGLAHERRGDNNAAAEDYRRALTLDPTSEVAQRRLKSLQSQ